MCGDTGMIDHQALAYLSRFGVVVNDTAVCIAINLKAEQPSIPSALLALRIKDALARIENDGDEYDLPLQWQSIAPQSATMQGALS